MLDAALIECVLFERCSNGCEPMNPGDCCCKSWRKNNNNEQKNDIDFRALPLE